MEYNGHILPNLEDQIYVITHKKEMGKNGRWRKTNEIYVVFGPIVQMSIEFVTDGQQNTKPFASFGGMILADNSLVEFTEGNYHTTKEGIEQMFQDFHKNGGMKKSSLPILDRGVYYNNGKKIPRHNLLEPK